MIINNFNDFYHLNKENKSRFFPFISGKFIDLFFIVLILFLLIFSFKKIYNFALKSDYFVVEDIRVDNLHFMPKDYFYSLLYEYFNLKYYTSKPNLLLLDLNNLKKFLLEKSNRIIQLDISKVYPSVLHFKIIERKPIGVVKINNELKLIDCNGFIFEKINNEIINLPILSNLENKIINNKLNEKLNYLLLFLDFLYNLNDFSISEIYFISENEINIFINYYNLLVKLNKKNLIIKFNLLKEIVEKIDVSKVNYIDLRFKDPIISFK